MIFRSSGWQSCFAAALIVSLLAAPRLLAEDPAPYDVATGRCSPRMERFDRLVAEFMRKHDVPGMAVAVTEHGKLIYARGHGYADMAGKNPVRPRSLFRIASVSKPITAVAVLQLVEQGKLQLDDKVFDILDHEAEIAAIADFDPRQRQVTVRQLLHHRGGWDRHASFDPMFQSVRFAKELGVPPPASPEHVIRAMLRRPLDFDPGARYAYSNYGYCLLGRVIEQRCGQTYEQYVKQHVLQPLGITDMCIGHTLPDGRRPREVCYYDPEQGESVFAENLGEQAAAPYGTWYLEAMDAHGGWLASATDLARLASAFDRPEACPILSAESIAAMYAPFPDDRGQLESPGGYYYSLGWSNRVVGEDAVNHWHTGSLPGTTATMIRRHDGFNFVALLNTRHTTQSESLAAAVDRLLHQAAATAGD